MTIEYPLITIGMTCFNAQDTIGRAIEGALVQDYLNFEIVLVDDCSRDNSRTIIEEAVSDNPKIRYIPHEKNTGFAGSLNTIIQNAKGEFLAIFDDDDVSAPERIRKQYERIISYERELNTNQVLCHVARIQKFENGLERYEQTLGTKAGKAPYGEAVANRILYGDLGGYGHNIVGSCANCARMGRITIFRELKGFDDSIRRGEDTDFSIRFALQGGHFVGIAEPLVTQKMTTGADKTLDIEYDVEKTFTQKYEDYLKKIGWYDFAIQWLDIRYANYLNKQPEFFILLIKMFMRYPVKTIQKLLWSLPARGTRKSFKDWHSGKLSESS